ncbi:MAG: hypothetical protein IPO17_17770 [Flavobacteriales bacterium]|nr:hypothetical protein [Flavobacteriales bacterium]MBK9196787.1 hypothetical protein [Flavobacteriales bacterium]
MNQREQRTDPFDHTDLGDFMESMVGETKDLWAVQKDYYALVASEKAARLSAGLLSSVVLTLAIGSVLVFVSLAAALYIGSLLNNMALGFLIMAGGFLLAGVVFMLIWRSGTRDKYILRWTNTLYNG